MGLATWFAVGRSLAAVDHIRLRVETLAYDRLMSGIPEESIGFHICVKREDGITIYDTCPTAEVARRRLATPSFATRWLMPVCPNRG